MKVLVTELDLLRMGLYLIQEDKGREEVLGRARVLPHDELCDAEGTPRYRSSQFWQKYDRGVGRFGSLFQEDQIGPREKVVRLHTEKFLRQQNYNNNRGEGVVPEGARE